MTPLQLAHPPAERLPDHSGRPDACVPGHPPPEGGVRQHGRADRPGRTDGETGRGNDTAEREPAAAGATGTSPEDASPGTERGETTAPRHDQADARQNRRESHRPTTPEAVPNQACVSQAGPENDGTPPQGSPGKDATRETTNAAATAEDPRAGSGPRHTSGDAPGTTDPAVPQRPHPRARSTIPTRPGSPGPEEGEVTGGPQPWERCRGGGGERGDSTTALHERTRTRGRTTALSAPRERRTRGRAGGAARGRHTTKDKPRGSKRHRRD